MTADSAQNDRGDVIQSYVVCIMDLLGQSERLQGWATLPRDGRPSPEFIEAFDATVGNVRGFRTLFEAFFDQFRETKLTDELGRLAPEHREQFARIREAARATQQFSDTFVFYSPVANSFGDPTGAALHSVLGAAAVGLLWGLARGVPLRGAITVGVGTELDPGNFYGPALVAAHHMESRSAEYPRVVLSQHAVDFAYRQSGFSDDPEIERLLVEHHRSPPDLLYNDTDGMTIVDFMGQEIQSIVSAIPELAGVGLKAYRFVRAEAARFEEAGDIRQARRYNQLLHYMRQRLSIWGIETSS